MTEEWPHLEPEQFDELVTEVMDGLPEEWTPLLENIAVVVEDEPSADEAPDGSGGEAVFFGLYRGATAPAQFLGGGLAGPAMSAPPEIALFQGPLERASGDTDELRRRVRETLVQEIGHHFGFRDDTVRVDERRDG